MVFFENRLVVPKNKNLRQLILKEAHDTPLSIHPVSTKMYRDVRRRFWWTRMREKSHSSLPNVRFVVVLRQNTKYLLVLLNHCLFPSGNGIRSVWTSSPASQKPKKEMMPSSWSLTDYQKLLTSFQFASPLLPVS